MGKESKHYIFLTKQLEFRKNQTLFQFCWEKQKKDVQIPWGWESKNWEHWTTEFNSSQPFVYCVSKFSAIATGPFGGIVLEIHNIQGPKESFSQSQSSFFFF